MENVQSVAEATLDFAKNKSEQWISDSPWKLMSARKEVKIHLNSFDLSATSEFKIHLRNRYKEAHKAVKSSTRADKRFLLEAKAAEAEAAASKGERRAVYRIIKETTGDFKKPANVQTRGRLLTRKKEIDNRWKEYFNEILNTTPPADPEDLPDGRPLFQFDISSEPIILHELKTVIRKLQNGKAAGIDGIHPELLKYGTGVLAEPLRKVLMQIWDTEDIPRDWKKGVLVKLYEKGRTTNCNNWRDITPESAGSNVFCQVLLNHIRTKVDAIVRDEQHGFRPSRSCADLTFSHRLLIEGSNEWETETIIAFIDFLKVCDSVHKDSLM